MSEIAKIAYARVKHAMSNRYSFGNEGSSYSAGDIDNLNLLAGMIQQNDEIISVLRSI